MPRPARVLWLIKGLGLGGAERLLTLAARHVDRSRFAYEAAYFLPWKDALVGELEGLGIRTTCLRHTRPFDLRVVPRVAAFLRERRIDVLHCHLPYTGVVGRLAARLAGVPCVVYTEHNVQQRYHVVTRLANQTTVRLADLTIAVSDEIRDSLLRSPLTRGADVRTIQNGVDADALEEAAAAGGVREEFGIPRDRLIVGVVSVFRAQKRLDLWLRTAAAIALAEPRSVFMVVGDGPGAPELRALAGELGLDGRVIFTGLRHDAPRLIAAFDVFMMSSIYEGLPVAVLEAMALGRPVVSTSVGGLPDVIEDRHSGLLVAPDDRAALAQRVLDLLADPAERRRLGDAARARVRQRFSIQTMVRATEDIYEQVLASRLRTEPERVAGEPAS
ncbi:MAG TPA: glycosyltransferase [Dehalococcoidia bacterium]|nr:glycosyltransferase [Dehalococcoidia bacterium]